MGIGFINKSGVYVECIKCGKVLTDLSYKKDDNITEHMTFRTFNELMKVIKEKNWKTDLSEETLKDFRYYGY